MEATATVATPPPSALSDGDLLELLALPSELASQPLEADVELSPEEQKFQEERRTILGGTDSAAICGLSSYRNAWDVAAEKKGILPPWHGNERTEIGRLLEEPVAQAYAQRTGRKLQVVPDVMRDARLPFLGGHPDRLVVGKPVGVEIKTVQFGFDKWSQPGQPTRVPKDYYVQCQHYMMVTGRETWDLVALFGLSRIRWYTLTRNERVIDALRAKDEAFWHQFVEGPDLPPVEPSDRAREWIKTKYPEPARPTLVLANEEQARIVAHWQEAKQLRERYEAEEESWKIRLQQAIGDATGIVSGGTTVTWKKNKDTIAFLTDWEAMLRFYAERHGFTIASDDIVKFTKRVIARTGPRVLRVKEG